MTTPNALPRTLGSAMTAAREARDAALADPLVEIHAIQNEWTCWTVRISEAATLARQVDLAQAAATAMNRRRKNAGVEFRRTGPLVDFSARAEAHTTPPRSNAAARRAARRRDLFRDKVL